MSCIEHLVSIDIYYFINLSCCLFVSNFCFEFLLLWYHHLNCHVLNNLYLTTNVYDSF